MEPKEIRMSILKVLYDKRDKFYVSTEDLMAIIPVAEKELDQEIRYLDDKGYLKIMSEFCGKEYLNFPGIKITSFGIDLVENPDEFNNLFSIVNNFHGVDRSNISIGSQWVIQNIEINELDDETKDKIEELKRL